MPFESNAIIYEKKNSKLPTGGLLLLEAIFESLLDQCEIANTDLCHHLDVDTRVIFQKKQLDHLRLIEAVLVVSPDTNVFLLFLAHKKLQNLADNMVLYRYFDSCVSSAEIFTNLSFAKET